MSVDNSDNDRVYPQKADFTFYGGLYRGVKLILVPRVHFALDYCGTPGIKVTPVVDLEKKSAKVRVETWQTGSGRVEFTIDGGKPISEVVNGTAKAEFTIENVHLWDGLNDPLVFSICWAGAAP